MASKQALLTLSQAALAIASAWRSNVIATRMKGSRSEVAVRGERDPRVSRCGSLATQSLRFGAESSHPGAQTAKGDDPMIAGVVTSARVRTATVRASRERRRA